MDQAVRAGTGTACTYNTTACQHRLQVSCALNQFGCFAPLALGLITLPCCQHTSFKVAF